MLEFKLYYQENLMHSKNLKSLTPGKKELFVDSEFSWYEGADTPDGPDISGAPRGRPR